jgi:hypothetical protein
MFNEIKVKVICDAVHHDICSAVTLRTIYAINDC